MKRNRIIAGLLALAVLMPACKKKEKDPSSENTSDITSDISTTTEADTSETSEDPAASTKVDFKKPGQDTLTEMAQRLEKNPGNFMRVMLNPRGEYEFDIPSNLDAPQTLVFEFQTMEDPYGNKTSHDLSWYDQELFEALLEEAFARIEKDDKLVSEINTTLSMKGTNDDTLALIRMILIPNSGRSAYCTILGFSDDNEFYKDGFFLSLDGESPVVEFTSVNAGFASPFNSFATFRKEDTGRAG